MLVSHFWTCDIHSIRFQLSMLYLHNSFPIDGERLDQVEDAVGLQMFLTLP